MSSLRFVYEGHMQFALRFVYNELDSTYEELLDKANTPTLHVRRLRTMALETFKILNNMSPPVLSI